MTSLVLVLVLFAAPSEAVSRAHFGKAQKAFAAHDWRRALDEFTAASESAPTEIPDLYFDIAQCHRNLGHARLAVMAYERYLALKPEAADKQKVRALIVQLGGKVAEDPPAAPSVEETAVAAEETAPPTANVAADVRAPTPTPTQTPTTSQSVATVELSAPPLEKVKVKRRWPIWVGVAAGVGLAAVAVGVGVGVGTSSSSGHGTTPNPMLGSAGTFDTRGH
jgi:hypothetical protein